MPVSLEHIRDLLLPGLYEFRGIYEVLPAQWERLFEEPRLFVPAAPAIIIPEVSLPAAVAMGVAAAVINNPIVTRRFWQGWLA